MPLPAGPACLLAAGLAGADIPPNESPAVLVEQGRVLAVGAAALAANAFVLELDGLWLSPAPLDVHVHLCLGGPEADNRAAWTTAGVAAIRDLGHPPQRPTPPQALEQEPPPIYVASGPGLCAQGEGSCWLAHKLAGPEAFAQAARQAAARAPWVKLFASGLLDFDHPGQVEHPLAMSAAEMAAATAAAHEAGAKVAVHASGAATVRAALEAGVDSVEHGYFLGEEDLAALARAGAAWSPTLAPVQVHARDPEGRHTPKIRANLQAIAQAQAKAIKQGYDLGVNLVMGSDAGSYCFPHGQALFMEMAAWLGAGVPAETVFEASTARAARLLDLEDEVGAIKPGARAWLLATREDPRGNPLLLAQPAWRSF